MGQKNKAQSNTTVTTQKSLQKKEGTTKEQKTYTTLQRLRQVHPPFILGIALVSLTSVVGHRFYYQPQLDVDTISPVRLVAPADKIFPDEKTTLLERKNAQKGIIPILKKDHEITAQIKLKLTTFLQELEKIRFIAGHLPFVDIKILSVGSQKYLVSCSEKQWQNILTEIKQQKKETSITPENKQSILELQAYKQKTSQTDFDALIKNIYLARQRHMTAENSLLMSAKPQLKIDEKRAIIQLNEEAWQKTKNSILEIVDRIMTQGIPTGLPEELLQETLEKNLTNTIPQDTASLATNFLIEILQPNLIKDEEATQHRAEQAILAVQPVMVEIKKGQVIVEAGQKISQEDFVLIDGFGLSRRSINWNGLAISALIVSGSIAVFAWVGIRLHKPLRCRDHILLLLLSLSTPLLTSINVTYNNLPAVGLLVSSFYNPTLAVTQVAILTGLVGFTTEGNGWEYLFASAVGGLLSAAKAGKLRCREEIASLGVAIGLTQGVAFLIVNLIPSAAVGTIWYVVLQGAIAYGISGVGWIIVALGISPYLERLFDLITPIRLIELSSPNRPLLNKLAKEAPGTFQHTMLVASLAEAAAKELGCNVELVRAGTLYHDIGKLHDPLGFIENQMGCPNKHDTINDPWKSTEIIRKHVTEGLVMARKYKLPKAISDFIPQHQGTLLISYFYFQAKNQAEQKGESILESDFRYSGPIPQSREAAIMMLADGCEAALRSLKDATPELALSMINKIFKARWHDNQLLDSGLKYEELPIIASIFVKVWQECNHQRIAYPKAVFDTTSSVKCSEK